jgi:transcriptional regulator with XRE-family HTH domain
MSKQAQHIRQMRIAAGFNQTQVAAEGGFTRQELSFIESGKLHLSTDTYDAIERAIVRLMERRSDHVEQMATTPIRTQAQPQAVSA